MVELLLYWVYLQSFQHLLLTAVDVDVNAVDDQLEFLDLT